MVAPRRPEGTDSESADSSRLDTVERWLQSVITHPSGVKSGIRSEEAQRLIRLGPGELEKVILPSKKLTAEERLGVYANAYYARLMECLSESFVALRHALGDDVFNDFAFGYLQAYPSRSYTLGRLGERFAVYLEETRPDRDEHSAPDAVSWPDFLIDLARLDWAIEEVFDGPGVEKAETLGAEAWQAVPPEAWPEARLVPVVCLKLLEFSYPVNDYYTAVRRAAEGERVPLPEPARQLVALTRKNYVVRRYEVTRPQFALLGALQDGETVGESIRRAAAETDLDDDRLAESLRVWFGEWTEEGLFERVVLPGA